MNAMIFAAGLGTRLRPLTNTRPKALVEIHGAPMLELVLRRMQAAGVKHVIINAHAFADAIHEFVATHPHDGMTAQISDERGLLLDTGGGLKHAAWFFRDGEPFLLHNADVLSNLDLRAFYDFHCARPNALATLAVNARPASRRLLFDDEGRLCGWEHLANGERRVARPAATLHAFGFCGIHVVSPAIFALMPDASVFSMIDVYLNAAAAHDIWAYRHDGEWLDVGTSERLRQAEDALARL